MAIRYAARQGQGAALCQARRRSRRNRLTAATASALVQDPLGRRRALRNLLEIVRDAFPGMFLSRAKIHRARNMVGKCVLLCCACIRQGRALPYSKPNVVGVIRHWLNRVPLKGSCAVAGHDLTLRQHCHTTISCSVLTVCYLPMVNQRRLPAPKA